MPDLAQPLIFAVVGDVHGHMEKMVSFLVDWTRETGKSLSFVLQVGDFEPHRHDADLATMHGPSKYRKLGDFHRFVSGELHFPWPVFFIGGNHEPYGFLDPLQGDRTVVQGCRFLGRTCHIEIEGLTIAGLSGVYAEDRFDRRPSIEDIEKTANKAYIGFTEEEVTRLLDAPVADILLVHEWPSDVIAPEDRDAFERQRRSMRYDAVGNEYARLILDALEPQLVCCGHMHRSYRSQVGDTAVCALANVESGAGAFAFFELRDGVVSELRAGTRPDSRPS